MTTSSNSRSSGSLQEQAVPGWVRSSSLYRVGIMVLILALLFTGTSYLLLSQLNYPEILIEKASFATALAVQGKIGGIVGFAGLLLCGLFLLLISLSLAYSLQGRAFRRIFVSGGIVGVCWTASALLGLVVAPLWANGNTGITPVLALLILVLAELVAPLLLAFWTLTLSWQFRSLKALSVVGTIGLLLAFARSLFWIINALLSIESGFYATTGILAILAVLGESFWLLWLFLLGFRLIGRGKESAGTVQVQSRNPSGRRRVLRVAGGLAVGLASVAFVGARTGLTIVGQPALEGDDVPAEPSFIGTLLYLLAWSYLRINPIHTIAQQKSAFFNSAAMPLPPGVTLEKVDARGVPAERIVAPGASSRLWIFYTHGGGFGQGITDGHRFFVAKLSQALGATGLLPDYRLTPEHPFPAGLNDCVAAYRWLLGQGVSASQIVIAGESAGGNLALTTILSLRESGDALPAVVVALSPATDLAMTGETYQTKAFVDPILGAGLPQDAFALYTNHGATDPRNPLVSPLYANLRGFPPTLLQVGTQEVLLSDSTRMADRLQAAGVKVKLEVWPCMFHAFTAGPDFVPEVRLATQHVVKFIRQHLGA